MYLDEYGRLEIVLQRFDVHSLKLKPSKCSLFSPEIRFLGLKVSRDGGSVTNDHTQCVLDWPQLKNPLQVNKFTGFVNYHREFCRGLAKTMKSLYALTKPRTSFEWTGVELCEAAFQRRLRCTGPDSREKIRCG